MKTCACGARFESIGRLRAHIALLTPRWPAQQCTQEHHDPKNKADIEYWTERAKRPQPSEDRRFK